MTAVRVAVLDTETTGLYPQRDRVIEIALALLEVEAPTGRVLRTLGTFEGIQDPGFPIPRIATSIHGITDAMVKGRRFDLALLQDLLDRADLLVAHNSGFDKGFVAQVAPEVLLRPWACSCRGIPWRRLFPHLLNARLQDLAEAFAIRGGTAHRALGDVETTLRLLALPHPAQEGTLLGHLTARLVPAAPA
jgi:DNA polymerase III subunit epsilon